MRILEIKDLYKSYGTVKAVNGLSFSVTSGVCFGLLGPNGAGKSTTIEIIEGIKQPSSGEVLFKGKERTKEFKEKIGIQFQSTSLQDYLTVREAIELFSRLYPSSIDFDEIVETCHLRELLNRDHRKLSGGQRQRLLLALALVNDPELIFLDEPTTGLDPQARQLFWQLVKDIKKQKRTIILTTHYMEEAYILCDEIIIVDKGKIITQGKPSLLLSKHFNGVRISLPKDGFDIKCAPNADKWLNSHDRMELVSDDIRSTMELLVKSSLSLDGMEIRQFSLEDLFIELTGKGLRA